MVQPLIARLKAITGKPICVGFGISTPAHARTVAQAGADGVIIGSRIVKFIEENIGNPSMMQKQIGDYLREVADSLACDSC
jgi:tryptophan synthase alpha subunit